MSDGGGESSSKEYKGRGASGKRLGGDDFSRAVAKIAVAQLCEAAGFQGFHEFALDTLSDVAVRYIRQIGKASGSYANLSGRSESNAFDIVRGLEDLGLAQGFSGASDTNRCLACSGIVREIAQYVCEEDENPFVYAIPSFPVVKDQKSIPSFAQDGDSSPCEHVPAWLPVFPEPQMYSQEIGVDNLTNKIEPFREQRQVENSLVNNLQQHMPRKGSEAPIVVDQGDDNAVAKQAVENNPFLVRPLKFGEKEVSSIVIPPKLLDGTAMREIENHVPVFEVFNPVAKSMKSPLNDTEEVRERVPKSPLNNTVEVREMVPNTRPTVQFKLKSFKKSSGTSLKFKIDDSEQMNSLIEVNSDKHGRKRRAEQIMKESMDIVEESAEL